MSSLAHSVTSESVIIIAKLSSLSSGSVGFISTFAVQTGALLGGLVFNQRLAYY